MSDLSNEIGRNIRTVMALRGMRQKDLCAETGLSPSDVSQYVYGRHKPGREKLKKIADALGMTPEALVCGRAVWEYGEKEESTDDLIKGIRQELRGIREELKGIKGRV